MMYCCCIIWILASFAYCSVAVVQNGDRDFPVLPELSRHSNGYTKKPGSMKLSALSRSRESFPGSHTRVFADYGFPSSRLNIMAQTDYSQADGRKSPLALPDMERSQHMEIEHSSAELEGIIQPSGVLTVRYDDLERTPDSAPHIMAADSQSPPETVAAQASTESPATPQGFPHSVAVPSRAEGTAEQSGAAARPVALGARDVDAPAGADASSSPSTAASSEWSASQGGTSAIAHSRHRPEPGLAPAENKPSGRRAGVPQLEMLENLSKPRKGAPEPAPIQITRGHSSPRNGVPDLEMLENNSKPRKGAPPPPLEPDADLVESGTGRPGTSTASSGPGASTEVTEDPVLAREKAVMSNLAKARAAVIVGVTFGVLSVLLLTTYGVSKLYDRWHHRHYRKMDFLVDGMYNM